MLKIAVKAERGSHRVDQGRLVENFEIAEDPGTSKFACSPKVFDLSPIVGRLERGFAVWRGFYFNYDKSSVAAKGEEVDLVGGGAELVVYRREDQICIEQFDVAPENRFQPRFRRMAVKLVAF